MISPARDSAVVPDDKTFGTAAPDAPITRADFERALRYLNMSDLDMRDSLLQLAAQVVTLTDELTRRVMFRPCKRGESLSDSLRWSASAVCSSLYAHPRHGSTSC